MYEIKNYIPLESRTVVRQALIVFVINYILSIWCTTSVSNLKAIGNVIRTLARFTPDNRKFDSIAPDISNALLWLFPLELSQLNMMKIYTTLYNSRNIEFFLTILS